MSEPGAAARAAAALYGTGARLYHGAYDRGWRRARSLSVPVLSVGNLTTGGTGKTPAVLALARAFLALDRRPAVLTRGYGGRRSRGVLRNGCWEDDAPATARDAGDEPLLLSRGLPAVPVVIGADRARGGERLLASGDAVDLFLMDDGFQHRGLARDRDLVLVDGRRPAANGYLLPAGPLREPPSALARAHRLLVVTTGPDDPAAPEAESLLDTLAPAAARSRVWPAFRGLVPLAGSGDAGPGDAVEPGAPVLAVAAIARPERFRRLLEGAGMAVAETRWFRDHHAFSATEVRDLEHAAEERGARLITTAKDAVRLEGLASAPWLVAAMTLEAAGGWDALAREEAVLAS